MKHGMAGLAVAVAACVVGLAGAQSLSEKHFESLKPGARAVPRQMPADDVTAIALERRAPHRGAQYTVVFKSNGTAEFTGIANTEMAGVWRAELPAAVFTELAGMAREIGFFDLQPAYRSHMKDLGTILTAVTAGGVEKIVSNYGGKGPDGLRAFESRLESEFKKLQWQPAQN